MFNCEVPPGIDVCNRACVRVCATYEWAEAETEVAATKRCDDKRSGSMLPALDLNFVASLAFCFAFFFALRWRWVRAKARSLGLMTGSVDRHQSQIADTKYVMQVGNICCCIKIIVCVNIWNTSQHFSQRFLCFCFAKLTAGVPFRFAFWVTLSIPQKIVYARPNFNYRHTRLLWPGIRHEVRPFELDFNWLSMKTIMCC